MEATKEVIVEERLDKEHDSEEENPYQTMIINDFEKIHMNINISQKQWSILINVINYVQYKRHPIDYYKLDIKALKPKNH